MGRAIADSLYSLGSSHRRVLRVRSVHVQAQKSRDMRFPRKKRRSQLRTLHDCLFRSRFADNIFYSIHIADKQMDNDSPGNRRSFPGICYTRCHSPFELQGSQKGLEDRSCPRRSHGGVPALALHRILRLQQPRARCSVHRERIHLRAQRTDGQLQARQRAPVRI